MGRFSRGGTNPRAGDPGSPTHWNNKRKALRAKQDAANKLTPAQLVEAKKPITRGQIWRGRRIGR